MPKTTKFETLHHRRPISKENWSGYSRCGIQAIIKTSEESGEISDKKMKWQAKKTFQNPMRVSSSVGLSCWTPAVIVFGCSVWMKPKNAKIKSCPSKSCWSSGLTPPGSALTLYFYFGKSQKAMGGNYMHHQQQYDCAGRKNTTLTTYFNPSYL